MEKNLKICYFIVAAIFFMNLQVLSFNEEVMEKFSETFLITSNLPVRLLKNEKDINKDINLISFRQKGLEQRFNALLYIIAEKEAESLSR